jgi:hypothetical protein
LEERGEDVEGYREMAEAEAEAQQGKQLLMKRWNLVVHVALDEARAEAAAQQEGEQLLMKR